MQDLPNVEAIRLSKNHLDLVRFPNDNDDDFRSVISCLGDMLGKCEEAVMRNWRAEDMLMSTIKAQARVSGKGQPVFKLHGNIFLYGLRSKPGS